MNYAQTEKLMNAIDALTTWSRASGEELNKSVEDFDGARYDKLQGWLAQAKQDIFDIVSEKQQ